jgi:hypothetical protein
MNAPTSPRVSITSLTFSDDTKVSISPDDVVIVVGPNNAGKSAALRAIRDKLQGEAFSPVLKALEIQRIGSPETLSNWLVGWTVRQSGSPVGDPVFQALGQSVQQSIANHYWRLEGHVLGALSRWFCHFLSADERLQICNPPGNIALLHADPIHPIHFLQRDDELELRLSTKFRKAFGIDLIVHRNAGNQVPLHVGARPIPGPGKDRMSKEFVEKLEQLPTLHSQGDGMRSFAGVLLSTSVGKESIMLIDEPEAFLHPPQARLLGTTLVQDRINKRQLFIATHSNDILRGVLDAESPAVKVLRIQRNGDQNTVRMLDNDRIRNLWGDPLLRYSNILDGLFHESVVVCEGDSDCRFYAAVLDAVVTRKSDAPRRPDLMFTHCGGKARLPVVIKALREVGVPVRVAADFDVLSEQHALKSIVEALQLDWNAIQTDWQIVRSAVESTKPELSTEDIKKEIESVLSATKETNFPAKAKTEIQRILRRSSPWSHAKSVGKSFVPAGDPSRACERLLGNLRAGGLFVVEVGELEGYVRTENGKGPKWVNAVLMRDLAADPELEAARRFVQDLAAV